MALPVGGSRVVARELCAAKTDPGVAEPDPVSQDPDSRTAGEANRLHKALEDTGIKLDCVASDILGKSGRAMLDALVQGTTDPEVLADLAKGRLRSKIPALKEALEGRFDHLHAVWIGSILAHLDFLDEQISGLTDAIGEQIAPFTQAVELLCTIPGVQRRTAEVIIAEIGVDMSVFPTDKQLASWAGMCPGNDQSAGKRRSGTTRKGSKWLDWALEEAAMAAVRTKDVYLAAQYARLRPRRGHKKALGAVKHSILIASWHMLSTGEIYHDSEATTTANATPNASQNGSSPNSKPSATTSSLNSCPKPRDPPGDLTLKAIFLSVPRLGGPGGTEHDDRQRSDRGHLNHSVPARRHLRQATVARGGYGRHQCADLLRLAICCPTS